MPTNEISKNYNIMVDETPAMEVDKVIGVDAILVRI